MPSESCPPKSSGPSIIETVAQLILGMPSSLRLRVVDDEDAVNTRGGPTESAGVWQVTLETTNPIAPCPACQRPSQRTHSRYVRVLSDVPCGIRRVRLKIRVRKFFCDAPDCPRVIFAERLPELTAPHSRRTRRLDDWLIHLSCEASGQAGARLARALQLGPWSSDTLLRLLRRHPDPRTTTPTPRVLGVDDWAKRKGQTYGTILCDLERRRVIDLLPERDAHSLSAWLAAHPGVEIICRDRASAYADGARAGAPHATQIADRFHLLMNLGDVVTRVVDRHRHDLIVLTRDLAPPSPAALASATPKTIRPYRGRLSPNPRPISQTRLHRQTRRQMRAERWQDACRLREQGLSLRAIGHRLAMNKGTVVRALQHGGQPPSHGNVMRTVRPFTAYLTQRWNDGIHNARQLHRELAALGHTVAYNGVADFVRPFRQAMAAHPHEPTLAPDSSGGDSVESPALAARTRTQRLQPRHVARLIAGTTTPAPGDASHLRQLCEKIPALAVTHQLAARFNNIVKEHLHDHLDGWLASAAECQLSEFQSFAQSVSRDKAAVAAALQLPWSSGQVEGQINRLKLIKRSMYGRGKLDLLRIRVLYKPAPN